MKFRKAEKSDAESVFKIIKACADDMASMGLMHWIPYYPIEKIENDINDKEVFIGLSDNNIVCTFSLTLDDLKKEAYLGKVAVLPKKSGNGIGTKCLAFVEEYLKQKEYKKIVIDVYDKSEKAIHFYEKNGFHIIGKKKTRRFEVYLMEKELI